MKRAGEAAILITFQGTTLPKLRIPFGPADSRTTRSSGLTIVPEMFPLGMSVLFGINRDFPYQVALPFNEIAMDVLDWLDDRSFEWDMYVDLPAGMVRYCFHTAADATAFTRQFVRAAEKRTISGSS